jgi:hypothetical protein
MKRILPYIAFTLLSFYSAIVIAQPRLYFDKDSLRKHILFLGNDSLEGRATGTRGGELAAEYISTQLQRLGIRPIGEDNTFLQPIPMHGSIPLKESVLRMHTGDMIHDFELGRDYLLYKAGAQTFLPEPVPLIFVGYGIVAPEFDYNDYQSVDVAGKIAVFLSGEPSSNDPEYFNGPNPTVYIHAEAKHRLAISRGALGSIMIPNPRYEKRRTWKDWQEEFAFEDVTLAYSATSQLSAVMQPRAAALLFQNAQMPLDELLQSQDQIASFPLQVKISFRGEFIEREFITNNVVGMLEGSDPNLRDTYIILSAHYDHLGISPPVQGDSIYNGVMDNAAGVAAVLEIARAFSQSPEKPRRSIIFLFLTGEEKGLLGSIYYTDHPIKPLYKTVANINVDGLAMFEIFKDVVGVGAELSSLGEMLSDECRELALEVSPIPTEFSASESYSRSDQIAFAQAGIPSILIVDGFRYQGLTPEEGRKRQIEWLENYYHTPFDDLNQPLNFDAAIEHCYLLFKFCQRIANQEIEPQWKSGTPYINARLQSIAEKR